MRPQRQRALRAHLALCAECRERYHAAVLTAAQVGRGRRDLRRETERAERRLRLRRLAFAPLPRRARLASLRMVIYPAFLMFVMVQVTRPRPAPVGLELTALAGEVWVGEVLLEAPHASSLLPGTWCVAGAGARARLSAGSSEVVLEGGTRLLVEDDDPPRVRLLSGDLSFRGSGRVVTALGIIVLEDADVEVRLGPGGLEIDGRGGEVRFTSSDLACVVAAGGSLRVPRPERARAGDRPL